MRKATTKNRSKILLSVGLVLASAIYVVLQYIGGSRTSAAIATTPAAKSQSSKTSKSASSQLANGTYTGNAADAYYGTVQVRAVIQNGKLASAEFLQYPSDRSTSRYINGQAMPILKNEAIQSQNANVNIVSGATFTSQAFQQSLEHTQATTQTQLAQ